jgi:GT2 family glycosyltransferase
MRLSIIIVNWNQREMLRDCLCSFVPDLDPRFDEVIVVDNGSGDESTEMVIKEFPSVRMICNDDNRGFAAANNQALKIARGRNLLLLNNDTLIHGNVLELSRSYLERNGDIAVLGCRVLNRDGSLQITCGQYPSIVNLMLLTSGLWKLKWPRFLGRYQMSHWKRDDEKDVDTVSGCYMLVRAAAMREVGMLDEQFFFFGEETDWCKRFRDAGWRVSFAPVGEITHFGSVSARRHNHKRDIMLSGAMVRLHRKHSGWIASAGVWSLLLLFNSSRVVFWAILGLFSKKQEVHERYRHFKAVAGDFITVWNSVTGARN